MNNIRSEEERNTRVAKNYENQQRLNKIYNRISFLRQSCRCRFVCTGSRIAEPRWITFKQLSSINNFLIGSREACEELMFLEDQLQQWMGFEMQAAACT